jgi:hypothetical protein
VWLRKGRTGKAYWFDAIMTAWCISEMFFVWLVMGIVIAFLLGVVVAIVKW